MIAEGSNWRKLEVRSSVCEGPSELVIKIETAGM